MWADSGFYSELHTKVTKEQVPPLSQVRYEPRARLSYCIILVDMSQQTETPTNGHQIPKRRRRIPKMRNLLIVPVLIILATLVACSTPSPEVAAPQEAPTLGAPTDAPTSGSTDRPIMAPTAAVEPAATDTTVQSESTWRGIAVATEHRCSPYDSGDYPYPASVEPKIVDAQGGIYGPYTGTWFDSIKQTDIEHIVARSEAHDSGLCASSPTTKAKFSSDLLNLTLASPSVNRHQKVANDAAQWLPDLNECWYVARTIQVRQEYGLTIDQAEADAIDRVLARCDSTEMIILAHGRRIEQPAPTIPAPDAGRTGPI